MMFNPTSIFTGIEEVPFTPDRNYGDKERESIRVRNILLYCAAHYLSFIAALLFLALFSGCSSPRVVEQHHHYTYEADTLAVQATVDRLLSSFHDDLTQYFSSYMEQYASQQQQTEQQHETVTETVTTATDSLGRQIRTEQRTISRTIARELQQQEQRLTQDYEHRLHAALDSLASVHQSRYDSLAARVAQQDSTFFKKTPVGDTRPWYQRWWDNLPIVVLALILFLVRLWWPLIREFRRKECK